MHLAEVMAKICRTRIEVEPNLSFYPVSYILQYSDYTADRTVATYALITKMLKTFLNLYTQFLNFLKLNKHILKKLARPRSDSTTP